MRSVDKGVNNQKYLILLFDVETDTNIFQTSLALSHRAERYNCHPTTIDHIYGLQKCVNCVTKTKHVPNLYTSIIPNSPKLKTTHKPMNRKMIVLYLQNRIL